MKPFRRNPAVPEVFVVSASSWNSVPRFSNLLSRSSVSFVHPFSFTLASFLSCFYYSSFSVFPDHRSPLQRLARSPLCTAFPSLDLVSLHFLTILFLFSFIFYYPSRRRFRRRATQLRSHPFPASSPAPPRINRPFDPSTERNGINSRFTNLFISGCFNSEAKRHGNHDLFQALPPLYVHTLTHTYTCTGAYIYIPIKVNQIPISRREKVFTRISLKTYSICVHCCRRFSVSIITSARWSWFNIGKS